MRLTAYRGGSRYVLLDLWRGGDECISLERAHSIHLRTLNDLNLGDISNYKTQKCMKHIFSIYLLCSAVHHGVESNFLVEL